MMEELSEQEFAHHADSADISTSFFFPGGFSSVSRSIILIKLK